MAKQFKDLKLIFVRKKYKTIFTGTKNIFKLKKLWKHLSCFIPFLN